VREKSITHLTAKRLDGITIGLIVAALAEQLGLQLETVPRVITVTSTEAYEAYLRGRYLVVQRTKATLKGAIREFKGAAGPRAQQVPRHRLHR